MRWLVLASWMVAVVAPRTAWSREVVVKEREKPPPMLVEFVQEPADPALFKLSPKFVARQGAALLQRDDYYMAVEREDLAISYRFRDGLRIGAVFAGGASFIVGSVLLYSAQTCDTPCASSNAELDRSRIIGVGAIAAGVLLGLGAAILDPHPADAAEIRRLADDYNDRYGLRVAPPVEEAEADEE